MDMALMSESTSAVPMIRERRRFSLATVAAEQRPATGQENVRASYRKGIGLGGLVKAEQLKLLMSRPLGLKDVTNPIEATGAADPESADEARRNAPLTVLTLDRIVSLRDYEDFCGPFPASPRLWPHGLGR